MMKLLIALLALSLAGCATVTKNDNSTLFCFVLCYYTSPKEKGEAPKDLAPESAAAVTRTAD
jgi:uncharacterized lipoprotein YmbA